jgi:hypothetical protein
VTCRQYVCRDLGSRLPEMHREVRSVSRISPFIEHAAQQQNGIAVQWRKAAFRIRRVRTKKDDVRRQFRSLVCLQRGQN